MEASIEKLEQQIYMQEEDKRIRALFTQKQSIRSNLELVSRRNHGSRDGHRMSQENHRSRNHNRNDNHQSRSQNQSLDLQLPVPPPGQQLPRNERRPPSGEYLETRRDHPQGRSRNPAERSHRDQSSSPLLSRDDGARESIRLQQQLIDESNSRLTGSETGNVSDTTRGTPPSPTYTPPKGIPTSNQPNRITRKKFSQISYF